MSSFLENSPSDRFKRHICNVLWNGSEKKSTRMCATDDLIKCVSLSLGITVITGYENNNKYLFNAYSVPCIH